MLPTQKVATMAMVKNLGATMLPTQKVATMSMVTLTMARAMLRIRIGGGSTTTTGTKGVPVALAGTSLETTTGMVKEMEKEMAKAKEVRATWVRMTVPGAAGDYIQPCLRQLNGRSPLVCLPGRVMLLTIMIWNLIQIVSLIIWMAQVPISATKILTNTCMVLPMSTMSKMMWN